MVEKVNVLVVGEGGREFAIAKKLQESEHVKQVYCAPGNVGCRQLASNPLILQKLILRV